MMFLHRLASVLRWMVHRDRAERDLNDELQAFVDMAAADRMRDGAVLTHLPIQRLADGHANHCGGRHVPRRRDCVQAICRAAEIDGDALS